MRSSTSAEQATSESKFFYGWTIVAVGFLAHIASAFSISSTLSIFLKPLSNDLGISRGVFSLVRSGENPHRRGRGADRVRGPLHGVPLSIKDVIQPLAYESENVKNFNSLQILYAERYVFSSNNEFSLAQQMIADHPEMRKGPRARFR